ncbi:MAG: hypothetical protein VYE15_04345 [Myxococcota bacterium]|nr:hypothetical protein [Myxococcota bacterium]
MRLRPIVVLLGGCLLVAAVGLPSAGSHPDQEPLLDHSVVSGRVFCDADGDGVFDKGERGLGGARVVSDHGYVSTTDRTGGWHLKRFEAGSHLVKLDPTSLPPGASVTTDDSVFLSLTAGMPARVVFGVKCKLQRVAPDVVEPPEGRQLQTTAGAAALRSTVTIAGRMRPLSLAVNGRKLSVTGAKMRLKLPQQYQVNGGFNIPWTPGPQPDPLVFQTKARAPQGATDGLAWKLEVTRIVNVGEQPVRTFHGSGLPPGQLSWDGTDSEQVFTVFERGGLYRVRMILTDGSGGRAVTRPITFGVGYGHGGGLLDRLVLRGALFDEEMATTPDFEREMDTLEDLLDQHPKAQVLLEVHTDDSLLPDMALSNTRKAAFMASVAMTELLDLEEDDILAMGYGSLRPLLPNLSERNREFNRRIEVTLFEPFKPDRQVKLPAPTLRARLLLQGEPMEVATDGTFFDSMPRPAGGNLSLKLVTPGGMIWERIIDLASVEASPPRITSEEDPLRGFGGTPLRLAIGDGLVVPDKGDKPATAARLEVFLPTSNEPLQSPELFVSGLTDPANKLTINGLQVHVDAGGRFGEMIPLPVGPSTVEVIATDSGGFKARVKRDVSVTDKAFFLLGLADAAAGMVNAPMPGRAQITGVDLGPVFVGGRGAVTFVGRIHGHALAEHVKMRAHMDTARMAEYWSGDRAGRFEAFHEQLIDPGRDYAVFGDASDDEQGMSSRGGLYVLLEADGSSATIGAMRTGIDGLELLRYDRALWGALVQLNRTFLADQGPTEARVFASEDVRNLRRGHDELRATGGSLYMLSGRDVVAGSERVTVVVREAHTRMELSRSELNRDKDYRIDYRAGRVLLKAPLSSTVDSFWDLGRFQAHTGRHTLDGNEVWLVVDYESVDPASDRNAAGGAYVKQRLFDRVDVGAGFVGESGGTGYALYGVHAAAEVVEGTRVQAEFAGSSGEDGAQRVSTDGGLVFRDAIGDTGRDSGLAVKVDVDSDVGRWVGDDVNLKVRGWYHLRQEGFRSAGNGQDQGTERAGVHARYMLSPKDELQLQVEGATHLEPDAGFESQQDVGLRQDRRWSSVARYGRKMGALRLRGEGAFGRHDDRTGQDHTTGGLLAGARYRLSPAVDVGLSQEALVAGDSAVLGDSGLGRLTTRADVGWRVAEDLTLGLGHAMRWDGSHGLKVGARTRLDQGTDAYVEQRLMEDLRGHKLEQATVLGTESRLEGGGRAYGEYRLDSGIGGRANRAVVGVGRRIELAPGISVSGGYERSEIFGGVEGQGSRDVLSGGVELIGWDWLKFGGRYELRLDKLKDFSAIQPEREVVQAVTSNGLTLRLSDSVTVMGLLTYTLTQNLGQRTVDKGWGVEQEGLDATLAGIYRPVRAHWLTLTGRLSRYQRRYRVADESVLRLEGDGPGMEQETASLVGGSAIADLPWRLRLTEKLTYADRQLVTDGQEVPRRDLLWVSRLGYRFLDQFDVAGEFRLLLEMASGGLGSGVLAEVGYQPLPLMRVALGYDFSSIPRELEPIEGSQGGGIYLRITGRY